MPVLKHAKKKLRQDKKRSLDNKKVRELYRKLLKRAKEDPTAKNISEAVSTVDKAVKKNILHKNKAAHVKSALSKLVKGEKPVVKSETKPKAKKPAAKKSPKTSKK